MSDHTSAVVRKDYRVLAVEDDPHVVDVITLFLGDTFHVEAVSRKADALDRLSDQDKPKIHAVVLDLMLPNGVGVEVVRSVNLRFPSIPIIVITGQDFTQEQIIESGAQEFLPKPFAHKELVRAVSAAIARHKVRGTFAPLDQALADIKQGLADIKQGMKDDRTNQAGGISDHLRRGQNKP